MIMWLLILSIFVLSFSAFFTAYLIAFYTISFKVATFAKATAMAIGFIGIIILIIATDWWWGLAGIVGYQILLFISRVIWYKRYTELKAKSDEPYSTGYGNKNRT